MKNVVLPSLYVLVLSLFLANCIREIDFQTDVVSDELVVSGSITDQPGIKSVRLTRPGNYNRRVFYAVDGADVLVRDHLGQVFTFYQSVNPADSGMYFCMMQGDVGRTYTLEVTLPDGDQYVSSPQPLLPPLLIDSVQTRGGYQEFATNAQVVVDERGCEIYANATAPDDPAGRYLRWEAESVHIFLEIPKIYYPIPPPQKQCFVTNTASNQVVAVADPSLFVPGSTIRAQCGWRRIDNSFEHRICFSVNQRTINREAYNYWRKVAQLLAIDGTVFDTPPGNVPGNVTNLTNPDKPARGFFEVASITTARKYLVNGSLGTEFLYAQPYCTYDYSRWPPVNHPECDDCLLLKNSTTEKPDWWE